MLLLHVLLQFLAILFLILGLEKRQRDIDQQPEGDATDEMDEDNDDESGPVEVADAGFHLDDNLL